jgi:hypothetical protein
MLEFATDVTTLASLATAAGTLVLALATFAAIRSSNRSARIAEVALQEQRRPVLTQSRIDDPDQKLMFVDGYWGKAAGGRGSVGYVDDVIYVSISLRNVGAGMGVCQGWYLHPGLITSETAPHHVDLERMHAQGRDIYIAPGDIGLWQGAIRRADDPMRKGAVDAIGTGEGLSVELLYTDLVGSQRTVTRFGLRPVNDTWYVTMSRHWHLDNSGPRPVD